MPYLNIVYFSRNLLPTTKTKQEELIPGPFQSYFFLGTLQFLLQNNLKYPTYFDQQIGVAFDIAPLI